MPYAPGPADDVFALGMTAYRLVTDDYPPTPALLEEVSHLWGPEGTGPVPPMAVNVHCCEELSRLVTRMLSVRPEARGGAGELAELLEQAARGAGPEADVPLFARKDLPAGEARDIPVLGRVPGPWSRMMAAASLGATVALGAAWMLSTRPEEKTEQVRASATEEAKDGGTVAVGEAALTAPVSTTRAPSALSVIAVDLPPKPLRGQLRPDASGRCAHRAHVAINGACWVKLDTSLKDCVDPYYEYKGACYGPAYPPPRPATSGPAERPGDDAQ
jgi:serine/threonine-protein kinase